MGGDHPEKKGRRCTRAHTRARTHAPWAHAPWAHARHTDARARTHAPWAPQMNTSPVPSRPVGACSPAFSQGAGSAALCMCGTAQPAFGQGAAAAAVRTVGRRQPGVQPGPPARTAVCSYTCAHGCLTCAHGCLTCAHGCLQLHVRARLFPVCIWRQSHVRARLFPATP